MTVELGLLFTTMPPHVLFVCASLYFSGLVSYHNFLFFFSVQWYFSVLLFLVTCFCLTIRQRWLLYRSVFFLLWSKQNLFRMCQNKLAMDPVETEPIKQALTSQGALLGQHGSTQVGLWKHCRSLYQYLTAWHSDGPFYNATHQPQRLPLVHQLVNTPHPPREPSWL